MFSNLVFEGDATVVYSLRHDFPEDRSGNHVRKLTEQKTKLCEDMDFQEEIAGYNLEASPESCQE